MWNSDAFRVIRQNLDDGADHNGLLFRLVKSITDLAPLDAGRRADFLEVLTVPKEADVPPQQGKPEKGAGEKNDEKKVEPFHLREKIEEMVDYGYPLTMSFPRKDRELADELKKSILTIYRLSIEIDRKYFKKTTTQNLDVELDVLRGMVRLAASKKLHGGKYPPPLTMHQYEVWAKYNEEIGKLLGGYIKTL